MDDDKFIKTAAGIVVILVVAPIVINGAMVLVGTTAAVVSNGINKVKYNRKIKKGLKDGSIIEIDGEYYGVEIVEEA